MENDFVEACATAKKALGDGGEPIADAMALVVKRSIEGSNFVRDNVMPILYACFPTKTHMETVSKDIRQLVSVVYVEKMAEEWGPEVAKSVLWDAKRGRGQRRSGTAPPYANAVEKGKKSLTKFCNSTMQQIRNYYIRKVG
jgi:hypothetical protein